MHNPALSQREILNLLSSPFDCSEAYKASSIDAWGTSTGIKSPAYTQNHRIVFNVKRVLETRFSCTGREYLLSGLCVVNEEMANNVSYSSQEIENALTDVLEASRQGNVSMEEATLVDGYVGEDGETGAPVNNTSGNAIPILPMIKGVTRRKLPPDVEKEKEIEDPDDTIDP